MILGDSHTHGKGTVQTVKDLGPKNFGSIKVTTARFYRIDGRSTQIKGVDADVRLPSLLESLDIGEDKLDGALPFTKILKTRYAKCWNLGTYVEPDVEIWSEDTVIALVTLVYAVLVVFLNTMFILSVWPEFFNMYFDEST